MWCQTNIDAFDMKVLDEALEEKNHRTKFPVSSFILRDEARIGNSFRAHFFTGLDRYDRETLWLFLGKDKWKLQMIDQDYLSGDLFISVQCQFLLTLAILRRNYNYTEAAEIFGISTPANAKSEQAYKIASRIFRTWLIFMYRKFRYVLLLRIQYRIWQAILFHFFYPKNIFKSLEGEK